MMAAGFRVTSEGFRDGGRISGVAVTDRVQLFEGDYVSSAPHANYDVAPGGKELVMVAPNPGHQDLIVVLDWIRSLATRLSGAKEERR